MASKQPVKLSGLLNKGAIPIHAVDAAPPVQSPAPISHEQAPPASTLPPQESQDSKPAPPSNAEPSRTDAIETQLVALPSAKAATLQYIEDEIDVNLIDENPYGPREIYTPEMLLTRASELKTQGQHDPIHVIPSPVTAGRYMIADGWTRTLSCKKHGALSKLKAHIHLHLTPMEAGWFGYESNEGRRDQCDYDRAMFYEKMIAEGVSQNAVAARVGIDKSTMSMYQCFAKLPDDVRHLVKEHPGKFSYRAAYYIFRIYDKAGVRKAVAVAGKFCSEDQTLRWLANQMQAVLTPSTHKSVVAQKYVRYSNGFYKQKSDEFELAIKVPPGKREAFAASLEALLSTVAVSEETASTDADALPDSHEPSAPNSGASS